MATAPTKGEIGEGLYKTVPIYEGTFTRADVQTQQGVTEKGGTYASGISDDAIKANTAYVIAYTSFADYAYTKPATGANGDTLLGRIKSIDKNVPEVAANGGTAVATLANARRAVVEFFQQGQVIMVRVDGSGTTVDLGDNLSLKSAEREIFVQDNSNGALKALKTTSDADAWIPAEVL